MTWKEALGLRQSRCMLLLVGLAVEEQGLADKLPLKDLFCVTNEHVTNYTDLLTRHERCPSPVS